MNERNLIMSKAQEKRMKKIMKDLNYVKLSSVLELLLMTYEEKNE